MKLLLDENLPHSLRRMLTGHDVYTVDYLGWKALENGELLRAAEAAGFDALITVDRGMQYERNVMALPVAVVILRAKSNRKEDILPLLPALLSTLATLPPRTLAIVP